jgi:catechol 2,3-dioxygenase-like lactoylglutathione lyase family enzyme
MSLGPTAGTVAFVQTADRLPAEAFYRDVIGLKFSGFDGFGSVFEIAGGTLRLTEIAGFAPHPYPALGWQVGDITRAVAGLIASGVGMERYEGLGQDDQGIWTAPDGKVRIVWFKDPDGNLLSLTQA